MAGDRHLLSPLCVPAPAVTTTWDRPGVTHGAQPAPGAADAAAPPPEAKGAAIPQLTRASWPYVGRVPLSR
jgi:hypothetical protein